MTLPRRHARTLAVLTVALACGCAFSAFLHLPQPSGATAPNTASASFAAGWNLISAPPGTDLAAVNDPLFTLQASDTGYEPVHPADGGTTGYGYWAFFSADTSLQLAPGSSDPYTITVSPGQFVMIGDPSGVAPASVEGSDQTLTYDPINGYHQATVLQPGQGAWAVSQSGGAITVTPQTVAGSAPAPSATPAAGLTYLQSYAPGSLPPNVGGGTLPADRWYYTFRIGGPPITGPIGGASNGRGVTLLPAIAFGWGRTADSNVVYISLPPGTPAGVFTVIVQISPGQTVSASFTHKP